MAGCSKILAGVKKLSICGNYFFILTLLGVCHETVTFFGPLNKLWFSIPQKLGSLFGLRLNGKQLADLMKYFV